MNQSNTPTKDPRIPPVVICDQGNGGDLYHVRADGFRIVASEDDLSDFALYLDAPSQPNAQPIGPIVTRIDFEPCEYCNATGHGPREWEQSWDVDEHGDPYPELHPVDPKCTDCDGLGWHYDFGANVSLARIVASVRGERAA